ncbi:hypothetical protein KUIN1_15070 [Pseudomonas sp. KUIN-1]|nr:hypothetical protein KUIN1_15070 [Pseudomonas sp. KUIN-1]
MTIRNTKISLANDCKRITLRLQKTALSKSRFEDFDEVGVVTLVTQVHPRLDPYRALTDFSPPTTDRA